MAAHNDITGDALRSRCTTDAYAEGYERVFGNKKKVKRDDFDEPNNEDYPEADECQQTTSTT